MANCTSCFCTRKALVGNGTLCAVHFRMERENKLEVFAEDVDGIPHYVDSTLRVWKAEDIENQVSTPRQIGTAVRSREGLLFITPCDDGGLETLGFALKSEEIIPAARAE